MQKLLEFGRGKNLGFSCFEVRQGAWFSLRKIRNKQTNHSVLLHRCNPLSSNTGKNFCKLMYQAHHRERQRGNPVTSHPSLRASAWQSIKIPFQAKTPEWRCSQIVIFLKVEGPLVPKRLWERFVIGQMAQNASGNDLSSDKRLKTSLGTICHLTNGSKRLCGQFVI